MVLPVRGSFNSGRELLSVCVFLYNSPWFSDKTLHLFSQLISPSALKEGGWVFSSFFGYQRRRRRRLAPTWTSSVCGASWNSAFVPSTIVSLFSSFYQIRGKKSLVSAGGSEKIKRKGGERLTTHRREPHSDMTKKHLASNSSVDCV